MKSLVYVCIISGFLNAAAHAQKTTDWKVLAKQDGFSNGSIAQLERDRILVTDTAYKQIFSPYLGAGTVFITSDSLLNAYHVPYEESFYHLEDLNASRLPLFLRKPFST